MRGKRIYNLLRPPLNVCRALAAVLVILVAWTFSASASVTAIAHFSVTVSNLTQTEQFYRDALGFETIRRERESDSNVAHLLGVKGAVLETLTMRVGAQEIEFIQFRAQGKPIPADSHSQDLWFQHFAIVVSDMDKAFGILQRAHFTPISIGGPQMLPPQNGSVQAFKFRDPDGHPLELLYFPPGQGREIWHRSSDRIFLGIDHSAIGISNTSASKAFYGGVLGMTEAYASINRGATQEALDGTFNAVVRITGMRPSSKDGPGLEFLEYRTPPTGRAAPVDTASNDLVHAHIAMRIDNLEQQVRALDACNARFISPGIVTLSNYKQAAMVRDPDGHALLLEQGSVR